MAGGTLDRVRKEYAAMLDLLAAGDTTFVAELEMDRLRPAPGDRMRLTVPRGRCTLLDPETERRLDADRLAGV